MYTLLIETKNTKTQEVNKMTNIILNPNLYKQGEQDFMDHLEKDPSCNVADLVWNAIYNDNYKLQSVAEGYYLITENIGISEGNQYLTECINADLVAVA